jgi:hypothetical protein
MYCRRNNRFVFPFLFFAMIAVVLFIYIVRSSRSQEEIATIAVAEAVSVEIQPLALPAPPLRAPIASAPSIELDEPEPPKIEVVRPAWADTKTGFENGVYRTVVVVGPYATRQECDDRLGSQLTLAAEEYIDRVLGNGASDQVVLPVELLRSKSVTREVWEEPIWSPRNKRQMVQVHALMEFDKTTRRELDRRWHEAQVRQRLWYTAGGAAGVLALVGTLFGYLRPGRQEAVHIA